MIVPHDQLSVHENICAKEQCSNSSIHELRSAIVRKESCHEPEQNKAPKSSKKIWHPGCEVIFCLTGEQCKRNEYTGCQDESFKYDCCVIERNYDGNGVGFQSRETTQEEKVRWIGFALPECQEHESDGSKKRDPHHPGIRLNPCLVANTKVRDGADGNGRKDLNSPVKVRKCMQNLKIYMGRRETGL